MAEFRDVNVCSADAAYDDPTDAPGAWIVEYADGLVWGCATEDEACAIQREYRILNGRDPVTGEAA